MVFVFTYGCLIFLEKKAFFFLNFFFNKKGEKRRVFKMAKSCKIRFKVIYIKQPLS